MSDMSGLKQAHGNWVTGERFWDREEEMERFRERIEEGANLLVVAQRRMGKTSLMKEAAERLKDDYECVFADFQSASNGADAIAELSCALHDKPSLWGKTKQLFANVLGLIDEIGVSELRVKLRAGVDKGNWMEKGDQLLTILAESEKPVILLMDEVPILVNRMLKGEDHKITTERKAETGQFMSWLRKHSLEHQGKVRFVISGSVGFEPILHQAELSATINNFESFELKPWDEERAIGCLHALARQYKLTMAEGVAREMVGKLGTCIPHHVQMFFVHTRDVCRRKKIAVVATDLIAEVYKSEMLGISAMKELIHYEERLKLVLREDCYAMALDILTETAISGFLSREMLGAIRKYYSTDESDCGEILQELLWVLQHDGYLREGKDGYEFVSRLLQDWWYRRYRELYTPVLKRGI